jgi:hypothetical protein
MTPEYHVGLSRGGVGQRCPVESPCTIWREVRGPGQSGRGRGQFVGVLCLAHIPGNLPKTFLSMFSSQETNRSV